jgi:hypothetical protein
MATALNNATQATVAQLSNGTVNFLGWMPNESNPNIPTPVQVTLANLAAAIPSVFDVIVSGTTTTSDANSVTLSGLPTMANQRCISILTGVVTAQNTTTGDSSVWDVVINLKRTGVGVTPAIIGGSPLPTTVRCQDTDMAACTVAASVISTGPAITIAGIAATNIEWAYTFTVVTAD